MCTRRPAHPSTHTRQHSRCAEPAHTCTSPAYKCGPQTFPAGGGADGGSSDRRDLASQPPPVQPPCLAGRGTEAPWEPAATSEGSLGLLTPALRTCLAEPRTKMLSAAWGPHLDPQPHGYLLPCPHPASQPELAQGRVWGGGWCRGGRRGGVRLTPCGNRDNHSL